MDKDYKGVIRDKRLEAGQLMTKAQLAECNIAIHSASVASAASGFMPIPVADAVPISAAQVAMAIALGKVFDQEITSVAAKGLIGAAAATFVGRNLVKLIPVVGWGVSAAVAAGVTEAIGWTIAVDMAKSFRKEWERQRSANDAAAAYAEAEFYKRYRTEGEDEEAEDFADL